MKKILSAIVLFLAIGTTYGQTDPAKISETIVKNFKLPTQKEAGKKFLQGRYNFVVELYGSIKEVTVKDSMGFGVDEQVIKQLKESSQWKVAEVGGQPKRVAYTLPMKVQLPRKPEKTK